VGDPNLHPHRFRHTFAIQFLRNGGNIFALQQLLGHSSLEMVKHYAQLAEMDLENAATHSSPADNWRL
jgi:integrase/recombinase XerD